MQAWLKLACFDFSTATFYLKRRQYLGNYIIAFITSLPLQRMSSLQKKEQMTLRRMIVFKETMIFADIKVQKPPV